MRNFLHRLDKHRVENLSQFLADLMRECSHKRSLEDARQIQAQIAASGLNHDLHLGNQLVQTYLKCGSVEDARNVFDRMNSRGRLAWTAIITAYIQQGDYAESFWLFQRFLQEGAIPDSVTFVAILAACSESTARSKAVHGWISESGLESQLIVANALMTMYNKMNRLDLSLRIFDSMPEKNVISWTLLITANARSRNSTEALKLFRLMQLEGIRPNAITFTAAAGLFDEAKHLPAAKSLHQQIVQGGFGSAGLVSNAIINMYSSCKDLESAVKLFNTMHERDCVTWNVIINAFADELQLTKVFELFRRMQSEGMKPNRATFLSLLNVFTDCHQDHHQHHLQFLHDCISESGYGSNLQVGNALLNLYGKSGALEQAQQIFHGMIFRDVISWTAMIGAYSQHLDFPSALTFFTAMIQEGIRPNQITFLAVLSSCKSLSIGARIHSQVFEMGFHREVDVGAALVEMYGKCGHLDHAATAFESVRPKNLVLWNVLIVANAQNGKFLQAIKLFWLMQQEGGLKPDEITLNAVISACAHAGLVSQGCQYFASMKTDFQLTSNSQHYSCLIDLLGRAGRLDEAEKIITTMPFPPQQSVRMAFLGACKTQCDKERGSRAAERVLHLDPLDHSVYLLLSHLHAEKE